METGLTGITGNSGSGLMGYFQILGFPLMMHGMDQHQISPLHTKTARQVVGFGHPPQSSIGLRRNHDKRLLNIHQSFVDERIDI